MILSSIPGLCFIFSLKIGEVSAHFRHVLGTEIKLFLYRNASEINPLDFNIKNGSEISTHVHFECFLHRICKSEHKKNPVKLGSGLPVNTPSSGVNKVSI